MVARGATFALPVRYAVHQEFSGTNSFNIEASDLATAVLHQWLHFLFGATRRLRIEIDLPQRLSSWNQSQRVTNLLPFLGPHEPGNYSFTRSGIRGSNQAKK